jgi:DNA repair protein RecN (Recombination protein N)
VAAQGHQHLHVSKAAERRDTRTEVTTLRDKARTEEIARMLGGVKITDTTTAHAEEMLERAVDSGLGK